jgi:hypothetical protein
MKRRDPRQYLLKICRQRASRAGLEFALNRDDIVIPVACPLLGVPLRLNFGTVGPDSPSIDRLDSTCGYVPGNVWVISHRANTLKGDATVEELEMLVRNLRVRLEAA